MKTHSEFLSAKDKICIVGLGYVGLPLAYILSKKYNVTGFDINPERIKELKENFDRTGEHSPEELSTVSIEYTSEPKSIRQCKLIIVTVPTPINDSKMPDLTPVHSASRTVGKYLSKGSIVVFESTVYPGVTEEECVPILEKESGLKWKKDFHVGYSPERVNPGDKLRPIHKIKKIVSGDSEETGMILEHIYGSVIEAGIHLAPSIKVAEAAKVIENTQRDLSIALMNELALIFDRLDLDTKDVLDAAATKWNFQRFEPGLVGGHCIGVDPFYLTHKAEMVGYRPEVILAGRRINDNMGKYIAEKTVKNLIKAGKQVKGSRVLILGMTFKENICDIRNSKVIDIYNELIEYGVLPFVYDPVASFAEVKHEYKLDLIGSSQVNAPYDAIIMAVKHEEFMKLTPTVLKSLYNGGTPVFIDVKCALDKEAFIREGYIFWRL